MSIVIECPFCNTCDRLSSHQALRIHVFRTHNIVLPTGYERKNALSKSKHAGVFYVCPSCVYSTESKDELKTHTEAHSLHIRSFSGADQWSLQGIDVIEKFKDFYNYCIQGINGFKDVDRFFNELLCLSSIIVLQKRHKYESIPNDYFSPLLLKDMYNTVKQSLSLPVELAADVNNSIKTILQDFSEENISKLQCRSRLIDLALQHSGSERNVILAIEAILPGIKDLDQGELHESEVGTTFVHPFLQALLAHEDDDQVARSSNTLPENGMEINRRPDYEVTMYEKYQPSYRSCYGEVKGEGHSLTEAILDFYRLAVFAKLELVSNNLTGVLCFQALGTSLTFYTLIHPNPAVYTFLEIATISIPKNKATIMTLMGYMDEIYKVACYHHTLNKSHKNNSKLPTLPFEFIQGKKKTLPMKRRPSLGALK